MKIRYGTLAQKMSDQRAMQIATLVCGLMLSEVMVLGGITVLSAHESAWLQAAAGTFPLLIAAFAVGKNFFRSSWDSDITLYCASVGALAWTAGAALQAALLFAIEPAWSSLSSLLHAYWL